MIPKRSRTPFGSGTPALLAVFGSLFIIYVAGIRAGDDGYSQPTRHSPGADGYRNQQDGYGNQQFENENRTSAAARVLRFRIPVSHAAATPGEAAAESPEQSIDGRLSAVEKAVDVLNKDVARLRNGMEQGPTLDLITNGGAESAADAQAQPPGGANQRYFVRAISED